MQVRALRGQRQMLKRLIFYLQRVLHLSICLSLFLIMSLVNVFFFFFPFHFSYIENNKNDFILSGAHEKMGSPLEIVGYIDSSKKGLEKQYLRTFTQKLPIVQLETLKSMLLGSNPSFITFCYFICLCYLFIYLSWHSRYFVVSLTRALLYHTSLHA